MTTETSSYDPDSQEATYWRARQRLASATRALNDKLVSTDIDPEWATALTEKIEGLTAELSQAQQVDGLIDMAKRGERGTIDDVMGELVSVGGRSPRAVVAMAPGSQVDVRALQAYCRDRLAVYKVPRIIEFWREIPKLPNGKIDKRAVVAVTVDPTRDDRATADAL